MNKSNSKISIRDDGGNNFENNDISIVNNEGSSLNQLQTTSSSSSSSNIINSVNKKRKSLILCDIKNSSSNNDENNIIFDDNIDDNHDDGDDDDDIDDVNDDDEDDELICNSIVLEDKNSISCDKIKLLNSTTLYDSSNSKKNNCNIKNKKINNCNINNINILNNSSNNKSYHLNNRHLLNQHQIEYDSQGEEEGFIDSSMESAIEIKECCTKQQQQKQQQQKLQQKHQNKNILSKKLIRNKNLNKIHKNQNMININNDNNGIINVDDDIHDDDNDDDDSDDNINHHEIDHNVIDIIDHNNIDVNNIENNCKLNNVRKQIKKFNNSNSNNLKNNLNLSNNIILNENNIILNSNNSNNINNSDDGGDNGDNIKSANDLICNCCNRDGCVSLKDILTAFNAPISEEQAWALIFQTVKLYRDSIVKAIKNGLRCCKVNVPNNLDNLNIHLDGSVHINYKKNHAGVGSTVTSHKKILHKIGHVIFLALDYNLQADEDCIMSSQLEHLISQMTAIEDIDDEGIERDSEDCEDLDYIIEACIPRVQPSVPEDHYKAVCRAFATEGQDLRTFLQKVFHGDTQALRIKADAVDSNQELDKLGFNDWARFWMQVVDELRQGVRLKRRDFRDVSRTPVEFELTPYEILMEDIRAKKYNLRKVMVNGDIPPRVKKDAHAVILEFIRSRPPLKKASERKLPPPVKRNPSPREQLMDSIRKGRSLKPIPQPTLKNRLLPSTSQQQQHESLRRDEKTISASTSSSTGTNNMSSSSSINPTTAGSSRSVTKNIQKNNNKIDFPFTMMNDLYMDEIDSSGSSLIQQQQQQQQQQYNQTNHFSQPKMPAYPITGYATSKDTSSNKTVIRRTKDTVTQDEYHRFFDNALESYDLATQCESRRASMRRHTIVGCQSVIHNETQSVPPSRPDSRQSSCHQQHQQQQQQHSNNKYSNQQMIITSTTGPTSSGGGGTIRYQSKANQSCEPTPTISTTNLSSTEIYTKNSNYSDDTNSQWTDKNTTDRLSLTLEEIVHIRSVMTKAELEGLPVGIRVKEEVEKRKICFLCLRTRFTIFVWGIQCKLCQRTVCSKCYSKMRIPTEHFRNVPVVLLSPSLIGSPASSSAASPCHHNSISHPNGSIDETFPKTLMERLMRSESDRKARNSVGSAPSSPKNQRSNMSTPGVIAGHHSNDLMTKSSDSHTLLSNGYNKENNSTTIINGGIATNRQVAGVMSRSMEGPRSLPMQSPGRAHSTCSTLDRKYDKNRFARALTLSSSSSHGAVDLKENLRGEMMAVCNDCRDLVLEIIRSSRQHRSSARNQALKNLTLDISPVYK